MIGARKLRASPALVIACLALFVALGSGSYAAVKLKANAVKTKNIKNAAVTTGKLADAAVSAPKIAGGAVDGAKIATGAIGADKIADGSVGKAEFAASGFAQNTSGSSGPSPGCFSTSFAAPGVRLGDVVSFSVAEVATDALYVAPLDGTVTNGQIHAVVCSPTSGGSYDVSIGEMTIGWIAFR